MENSTQDENKGCSPASFLEWESSKNSSSITITSLRDFIEEDYSFLHFFVRVISDFRNLKSPSTWKGKKEGNDPRGVFNLFPFFELTQSWANLAKNRPIFREKKI